jgi:hypothetical protein
MQNSAAAGFQLLAIHCHAAASQRPVSALSKVNNHRGMNSYVKSLFASVEENRSSDPRLDEPLGIVDEIYALAMGRNVKFRTPIGEATKKLIALRNSVPIEQYLETLAASLG